MNTKIDRRRFLQVGLAAGAAAVASTALVRYLDWRRREPARDARAGGYGRLTPTASRNTGEVLLALPEGFQYTALGHAGALMSDGIATPPRHDGMAAFHAPGGIRLLRNHELYGTATTSLAPAEYSYDPAAMGGVTTVVVDPVTRELLRDFVSLSGTLVNCAGGATPWGTWISCEETVVGTLACVAAPWRDMGAFPRDHGYCFEVDANAGGPVEPIALTAMGRFVHEAVAVDPATSIVYLTEDQMSAGFYRFLSTVPGKLVEGGRLEMLAVEGLPGFDTRTNQHPGSVIPCRWVPIVDPDPADAHARASAVFEEGHAKGGAIFGRLEGCWYGDGSIYMNATFGGDARVGQVWRYIPHGHDAGHLVLVFESPSMDVLNSPDNICVSPRGGLVLCEDFSGPRQHVCGLSAEGEIFDLARNEFNNSEFAGATFSPDGETLFVNIQEPGITLAIWGDWRRPRTLL